ncbi:MAG: PqqD family peptide modification chaperone [Candidatus Omnitrophota bacterium]|nr:PqqD family peptide modification chaperone [Candidatus Omnitrophota bacterium]
MKPKVSVIVPVYNGEKTLSLCLNSLMNLDFPKLDMEIIVVDNNSTDATKDIIMSFPVKYAFESKRSRGAARNRGIKESSGAFVAFIDADCIADKLWLKNLINGFTSEIVGGCGGEIRPNNPQAWFEKFYDFKFIFPQQAGLISQESFLPNLTTANAVYMRKVLNEVDYFDDSFVTLEDIELSWRVYLKGYHLNYVRDAIVYCKHSDRLSDFLIKWFEDGYYYSFLRQKYVDLFKKSIISLDDCLELFFALLQSTKAFFIALFKNKNTLETYFIYKIIRGMVWFLGRIYGLLNIKLNREEFFPQLNPDIVLWRMVNDEVVISEPKRDFRYVVNKTGAKIWRLLMEKKDISEIIDLISGEYKVKKEEIREEVLSFFNELKNEGLTPP